MFTSTPLRHTSQIFSSKGGHLTEKFLSTFPSPPLAFSILLVVAVCCGVAHGNQLWHSWLNPNPHPTRSRQRLFSSIISECLDTQNSQNETAERACDSALSHSIFASSTPSHHRRQPHHSDVSRKRARATRSRPVFPTGTSRCFLVSDGHWTMTHILGEGADSALSTSTTIHPAESMRSIHSGVWAARLRRR